MGRPLHITHGVLSLDVGGLERLVIGLIRSARQRGHRLSVVCIERPGQLADEAEAAGADVISLEKPPGRFAAFVGRAADTLSDLKPDVVHTHQLGAAWYLGQPARSRGVPVLHTEHGDHFARSSGWRETIKTRLLYRQTGRSIDRFCCVSAEIARGVIRWGTIARGKVEVVPNGIPTDRRAELPSSDAVRQELGIPAFVPVIGTVGRLAEIKQQDLLIRAVARLREKFQDIRLLLIGNGPERHRLEALAAELRLGDRVHFTGYQSCPEKFLQIMDVFCLPSRSEGFPISLLEAWLAGVPAVCSAVGGIPTVVTHGQNGLLVPPGDESALVNALSDLLGDRATRDRLAEAGQRVVRERFSLDRLVSDYEVRYRNLLSTSGAVG